MSRKPSPQTENQDRVLQAIANGARCVESIIAATELDEVAVRNAVRRLFDAKKIRSYGGYAIAKEGCLLERYWKGTPVNQAAERLST